MEGAGLIDIVSFPRYVFPLRSPRRTGHSTAGTGCSADGFGVFGSCWGVGFGYYNAGSHRDIL